ncbi:MAG: hypothetical protein H6Q86_1653 [candidate division NC10 bacterium]|nr:hypothetical protein [candidate division NC10 bacterium]
MKGDKEAVLPSRKCPSRKSPGMAAHTVIRVEEQPASVVAHVDRLPGRQRCCQECDCLAIKGATTRRPARGWQDLGLRDQPL